MARSGRQWETHSLAESISCGVSEKLPSSTPPPAFPNTYFSVTSLRRSHHQQAGYWLGFVCFLSCFSGLSGRFSRRVFLAAVRSGSGHIGVQTVSDSTKFPPFHSAWGMRGRADKNSHVWMNKRAESDAIAAEMEENTLPGSTCKSFFFSHCLTL